MTARQGPASLATPPRAAHGIAVYFEHPTWFEPLFAALERLGSPAIRLHDADVADDPARVPPGVRVLINRMSISSQARGRPAAMANAQRVIAAVEARGVRVINGSRAMHYEVNKLRQLDLIAACGLAAPTTFAARTADEAVHAAEKLAGPVLIKPNFGASGIGIRRYESSDELRRALADEGFHPGLDGVALVQRYVPARDRSVVRVEAIGGRFHYAVRVRNEGASFNLCCASVCRAADGRPLERTNYGDAAPRTDLTVERFDPPQAVRDGAVALLNRAGIDVGGVEYLIDDATGEAVFFDINALSNFVAGATTLLGFDPYENLARLAIERGA